MCYLFIPCSNKMVLLGRRLSNRAVLTGRDNRTLLVAGRHRSRAPHPGRDTTRLGRERKGCCGSTVLPRALPPSKLLKHNNSSLSSLGVTLVTTTPGVASGRSGGEKAGRPVAPISGRNLEWRPGPGSHGYSKVAVAREGEDVESRITAISGTTGKQVRNQLLPPFTVASFPGCGLRLFPPLHCSLIPRLQPAVVSPPSL